MIRTISERLMTRALEKLVHRGSLTVVLANGRCLEFGDKTLPKVTIRFSDAAAEIALLRDPDLQLGELFMNERLILDEGTIYELLELLLRDSKNSSLTVSERLLEKMRFLIRPFQQNNQRKKARANVAHHYDLGNALYDLFLDKDRQYSCAYFEHPYQGLDEAQVAKRRHIAAKLLVERGHRILDIGCGWGGLSSYLAETTDAEHVTGITLSTEQIDTANKMADASSNSSRLTFRLEDYRDTKGPFDRIVSVGMFEHVGIGFYEEFFKKCHELLSDDGVMLLHFIGHQDVPDYNHAWIEKYIFPGGHLATLSEVMPIIERCGLIVTDLEVLRLHYARTLFLWRQRFMANREKAKAMFDERFCKMWEFYLSMSEAAFRYQDIAVFQIQLAKRQESVPLTRDYIAQAEAQLRAREKGRQSVGQGIPDAVSSS